MRTRLLLLVVIFFSSSCTDALRPDEGLLWLEATKIYSGKELLWAGAEDTEPIPKVFYVPGPLKWMIKGQRVHTKGVYSAKQNVIFIEDTCKLDDTCEDILLHEMRHAACMLYIKDITECSLGEM